MNEHVHVFDPISGYCIRGCVGYREDGRLIHKGGAILRPAVQAELETTNQPNRSE